MAFQNIASVRPNSASGTRKGDCSQGAGLAGPILSARTLGQLRASFDIPNLCRLDAKNPPRNPRRGPRASLRIVERRKTSGQVARAGSMRAAAPGVIDSIGAWRESQNEGSVALGSWGRRAVRCGRLLGDFSRCLRQPIRCAAGLRALGTAAHGGGAITSTGAQPVRGGPTDGRAPAVGQPLGAGA